MKKVNEILVKVSGKIPIDKDLDLGDDITLIMNAGVVKKEFKDNQDGTMDVIIVVKPIDIEALDKKIEKE